MTGALARAARRTRRLLGRPATATDHLVGPIRGEPLGADRLAERARTLARQQRVRPLAHGARRTPLLTRLDATREILTAARARLAAVAEAGGDVGPAGEWILDNFHVIEEHVGEVRASLPRSYYGELAELDAGHLAGYPRVYEIATTLISHTEGRVDRANVDLFVSAYQEVVPLAIGELWAIPAMLRLALIENLRRMARRAMARLDEIDAADRWAVRIMGAAARPSARPADVLAALLRERPSPTPEFVGRLVRQLRAADDALASVAWLESWLADEGAGADDAAARVNERLALGQVATANSLMSLRAIGQLVGSPGTELEFAL